MDNQSGNLLKELTGLGLIAGAAAIEKALSGSPSSTTPDPKHAHRVFISHSWAYGDHFQEVKPLLDNAPGIEYFSHSVSSDDSIVAQIPSHLRKEIRDQMGSSSVVLVLARKVAAHSDWFQEEIGMSVEMKKPIIGLIPAVNERVPAPVQENTTELVEADGHKILDAIERHA